MSEIDKYKNDEMVYLTDCGVIWHTDTVEQRLKAENDKYKQCLDEIEKILLQTSGDSQSSCILAKSNILQLIKQAKEGING